MKRALEKVWRGESVRFETEIKSFEKGTRFFLLNLNPVRTHGGEVIAITLAILENTQEISAAVKANKSEQMLRTVFDVVTTGVCVTDATGFFYRSQRYLCSNIWLH
ncbi:PAS domain-containing protein [Mongoliitalea lutea]|uniref:PAS fold-4 domain-containing protein n=1 Tax=Mongoliitalea lutea TaxID=849756 RepID=A0A8J3CXR7_9BACT|nr:PAS domain-containing protein [Mongoliitalea lutea]GHB35388.1 hypothetical protein GCM10008106_16040 [Mongoliitalea lutea]